MKFLNFDQTEYLAVKWRDFRIIITARSMLLPGNFSFKTIEIPSEIKRTVVVAIAIKYETLNTEERKTGSLKTFR